MYLYLVFIFAFLIRLIGLNQSLWLDEAIVERVVRTIPFHLIPTSFSPFDFHPPLYYMGMSIWTAVFKYSEITLRLPSVIASLLTGFVIYKIGVFLGDKKKALWAAAFFLFNPLVVYYSQEARMYMMATLFTTCALYYFLHLIKGKKQHLRHILLFNLFCILSIFTFYGTLFFIGGMIIVGFFTMSKKESLPYRGLLLGAGTFISLILLSSLLIEQFHSAKVGLVDVKNWSLVLGKAEVKNVAMIFLKFTIGRLSWYPKWSYYLVTGCATVLTWIFVASGMKKNKLLGYLFVIPLFLGLCVSFWAPMMQYFRFLYLVPVMCILLGEVIGQDKRSIGLSIIFISLAFSFVYLLSPQFHREDWESLSKKIDEEIPVYMILPSSDPVSYYNPSVSLFELRKLTTTKVPEIIQVIPYVEEVYGLNHIDMLNKMGCLKMESSTFRGPLFLEKWKCLKNS